MDSVAIRTPSQPAARARRQSWSLQAPAARRGDRAGTGRRRHATLPPCPPPSWPSSCSRPPSTPVWPNRRGCSPMSAPETRRPRHYPLRWFVGATDRDAGRDLSAAGSRV